MRQLGEFGLEVVLEIPDVGYQFAVGGETEVEPALVTDSVILRPRPSISTLTGCRETTSAPAQYSGVGEPGMFEIVVLNGGSTQPAAVVMDSTREVRANSAGGTVWFASCMRLAGSPGDVPWRPSSPRARPCQALTRIGFVGGNGDDHGRDPIAVLAIGPGADRERHHGHKWAVDLVTTGGEAPP